MGLINISGKTQSGKDTLARVIQYLFYMKTYYSLEEANATDFKQILIAELDNNSYWQIKRFADPLKKIVSILTGIPIKDLEKEEVKNMVLGKEWDRPAQFRADCEQDLGTITTYFDTIEEVILELCSGWDEMSKKDIREELQEVINGETTYTEIAAYDVSYIPIQHTTVRWLMQHIGTDGLRSVHSDIHVNALMKDCTPFHHDHIEGGIDYPNWIIPDTRFSNELKAGTDRNALIIRIERPIAQRFPTLWNNYISNEFTKPSDEDFINWLHDVDYKTYAKLTHESETALDNVKFSNIIHNTGNIAELISQAKHILTKHKLI